MTTAHSVKVVQKEDDPVPTEVLAESIVKISKGMDRILSGRLNRRALILLIADAIPSTGRPNKRQIEAVLDSVQDLAHRYVKKK